MAAPAEAVDQAVLGRPRNARLRKLSSFFFVGGVAFVIDVGGFNLLRAMGIGPLTSKAISTSVSIVVAYLGNRTLTFRASQRGGILKEFLAFLLVNAAGAGAALVCLAVSHYGLGLTTARADNVSANIVGVGLGTVVRYIGYQRLVFRERSVSRDM